MYWVCMCLCVYENSTPTKIETVSFHKAPRCPLPIPKITTILISITRFTCSCPSYKWNPIVCINSYIWLLLLRILLDSSYMILHIFVVCELSVYISHSLIF